MSFFSLSSLSLSKQLFVWNRPLTCLKASVALQLLKNQAPNSLHGMETLKIHPWPPVHGIVLSVKLEFPNYSGSFALPGLCLDHFSHPAMLLSFFPGRENPAYSLSPNQNSCPTEGSCSHWSRILKIFSHWSRWITINVLKHIWD